MAVTTESRQQSAQQSQQASNQAIRPMISRRRLLRECWVPIPLSACGRATSSQPRRKSALRHCGNRGWSWSRKRLSFASFSGCSRVTRNPRPQRATNASPTPHGRTIRCIA